MRIDSKLIRSEREKRGWSQNHLARVAGLGLRTIQRIEKTGSASFESGTALASVLSVEVADLRAKDAEPTRARTIRLSLELPVRLALATASGVACAFLYRSGFPLPESLDYAIAGFLFGLSVLCPYLRLGHRFVMRALGLIGASAASYFCAVMIVLNADSWFTVAPVLASFLLASVIGVTIVLVAAKLLIPLQVTAAYWLFGLVASLAGGVAMFAGFELFGETTLSTVISYCAWHILACIAIYGGRVSSEAPSGLLAAFMRTRGRFSLMPGWMNLSQSIPS